VVIPAARRGVRKEEDWGADRGWGEVGVVVSGVSGVVGIVLIVLIVWVDFVDFVELSRVESVVMSRVGRGSNFGNI
jgi:hypothetical protein